MFAQYRADLVASAIRDGRDFDTSGNLSGSAHGFYAMWGWERMHPVWAARLVELLDQDRRGEIRIQYAVYSFRTVVAVLWTPFDAEGAALGSRWAMDAAAHRYSVFTSKAVSSFERAVGLVDWFYPRLPAFQNAAFRGVELVGKEWLAAEDLSAFQRKTLARLVHPEVGVPPVAPRRPTRDALVRHGLLNDSGSVTDFGLAVSRYCV